jgi:Putative lumazine-binding
MKVMNLLVTAIVLLFVSTSFALRANNPADEDAVKQVIQDYIKGTDAQNADALEKILYPEGNYYNYNTLTNKASETTNDKFLEKVKNRQIGGWDRKLNISSVDVNDNTAIAKIEISDTRIKQHGYLTLIKEDGNWKIMSGAYTLETAK